MNSSTFSMIRRNDILLLGECLRNIPLNRRHVILLHSDSANEKYSQGGILSHPLNISCFRSSLSNVPLPATGLSRTLPSLRFRAVGLRR